MSPWRALLCIFLPPLAVLDKGCGMTLHRRWSPRARCRRASRWRAHPTHRGIVTKVIAAFVINLMDPQPVKRPSTGRFVQIPVQGDSEFSAESEKPKRKGAYVRLADGEIAEVIEDDGAMPDVRKLSDERDDQ